MKKYQVLLRGIQRHVIAIAASLVVGSIAIAPHILAKNALDTSYQGYPFLYANDEDFYIAKMQDIVEGYWFSGSPYFF